MRTNRIIVLTSKGRYYIVFCFFCIMLMTSCRNRVKAASDKLDQSTPAAAVDESVQDSKSDRIIYSPNGDLVDEEGISIIEPVDTNEIYIVVEEEPEFPGGIQALADYLRDNIKYPEACRKDSIQGRVIIRFVVEKDGSISGAKVLKGVHELLDAETMRVISAMPKWKPGKQRGKEMRVQYAIPVNFSLDGSPYLKVPQRSEITEITESDSDEECFYFE